jgi:hypothetical protein
LGGFVGLVGFAGLFSLVEFLGLGHLGGAGVVVVGTFRVEIFWKLLSDILEVLIGGIRHSLRMGELLLTPSRIVDFCERAGVD